MLLYVAERFDRGCSYDIEVSFSQSLCVAAVDYDYNWNLTALERNRVKYTVSGYEIPDCITSKDACEAYRLFVEWCFEEYGYIVDPVSAVNLSYGGDRW